jgi:hypothetical protein
MQQLRQIIPALMIGVLAGGIGTYQSLQSNPTNTNPNPMFTTQSVAGTREQPPSDGGTEDLKIGKKFIPCPGSEEFLKGTLYGGMTEWQLDGGISWPAWRNLYSKSKYTIWQIYAQTTNPFPQPTDLLCQYEIDPVRSGTLPLDRSFFNRALWFPKWWCTAINEPTRIGFECDTAWDTPNDWGLGQ